ncbi:MAG TPA: hypothetical protein VII78_17255 [Myxococcota bacterium]
MSPRAGRWLALLVPLSVAASGAAEETLLGCRKIEAADQRLACYDRVLDRTQELTTPAAPLPTPLASSSASPPPDDDAKAREGWFGKSSEKSTRALRASYGVEPPRAIASTVATSHRGGDRLIEATLANGQVWKQADGVSFALRPGDRVAIEVGALGAYYLRRNGEGRSIRVKRIR